MSVDWSTLPLGAIGQGGLITFVVLLVLTDRLVWHRRLDVLEERVQAQDAIIATLTQQNTLLVQSAIPTVNSVLSALHRAAEET